jgi:peptidyl-prolyl cis-trans isomerase D
MLQAIRSKATSFVVKILFGLLILTFGVWGIGDIFRSRGPDSTVATVGGRTITADQLSVAVQNELERMRRSSVGSIDAAQAKQLGVVDQVLQRLITSDLVMLEVDRMGLALGDRSVRDAILTNPMFQNPPGKFDRTTYTQTLAANHVTEQQYEAILRDDLLRAQLVSTLVNGLIPPKELVSTLYRERNESRVADFVLLPADIGGAVPQPNEEQIAAFYHAHEDQFRAPERRTFQLATLKVDDLAAGIELSDDQLKKEYQTRIDEFRTPEKRHVMQILFTDEAAAEEAETQLAAGKDFAAVAKDVAKTDDPTSLDLGWVSRDDLPKELADPVFALEKGSTTAPIKTTFGWHVLRVTDSKAGEEQTFEQAKDKLKTEVAHDRAADRIADTANQVDDALAGGGTFETVVAKFGMKTTEVTDIAADGSGPDGKEMKLPDAVEAILHTAFATSSGQTSALSEMGDDGYFLVRVDKVTAASTKPLADVHDDAAKLWRDEARTAAQQKIADAMVAEVKAGKSLKEVAAAHGLAARTSNPVQRSGGDARLPATIVAKLFDTKPGEAVADASGDNVVVAQLDSIDPADPEKDKAAVQKTANQIGSTMQDDLITEFNQSLRRAFPVEVNQASVDRVL